MKSIELPLKPVKMTEKIMAGLEQRGLIYRLCPGHDVLRPDLGSIASKEIYAASEEFGPHRLISVTIDRYTFDAFGIHSENEEFLLIGDTECKPLLLLIFTGDIGEMQIKIKNHTLKTDDFILLECEYNNPYTSFFVMKKRIPHGEATVKNSGNPPTFYVTESKNLDLIPVGFGDYSVIF